MNSEPREESKLQSLCFLPKFFQFIQRRFIEPAILLAQIAFDESEPAPKLSVG